MLVLLACHTSPSSYDVRPEGALSLGVVVHWLSNSLPLVTPESTVTFSLNFVTRLGSVLGGGGDRRFWDSNQPVLHLIELQMLTVVLAVLLSAGFGDSDLIAWGNITRSTSSS